MSKRPADLSNLEFHPLANLFPLIVGAEFEALVDDIEANGIHDEIVMLDGKILDGRNRYRAGNAVGLFDSDFNWHRSWMFSEFSDIAPSGMKPLAWVLSKNLHRRHLSSGQRAMIAADIATMKAGTRTDLSPPPQPSPQGGGSSAVLQPPANLQKVKPEAHQKVSNGVSVSDAAQKLQVSPRSVSSAKKVQEHGTAGLADAVRSGGMAVSTAADIADLSVDEQVKAIESADPKAFAKVAKARRDEKTATKKAKRVARERELGDKQLALPTRKFGVVYADPEWKFETYSAETGMDRAADNHYTTSTIEAIKERPVADISADDCALFLWATVPMLEHALDVLNEWGFKYRSQFIWRKIKPGTGYWNRNRHEILLIGTRGKVPCPAQGEQWGSVITAELARHSQKPDNFYHMIEHYFPNLPKIELNARGVARDGWCAWGNETEGDEARGITLVDGVSDASHLPLLPNPGKPLYKPPSAQTGPSPASPPVGTKARVKPSKNSEDMSAPIVARVNIDDLELLVRVADKKISFYAMQKHPLFPSELGCVSADCFEIVTAANISAVSKRIWSEKFVANASASMRASTWRLVTTPYKMGRTGPIPVMSSADEAGK